MFETKEMDRVLNLIESLNNEETSVKYLREFTEIHRKFSKILFDTKLSHEEWTTGCVVAKKEIDEFLGRLEGLVCLEKSSS